MSYKLYISLRVVAASLLGVLVMRSAVGATQSQETALPQPDMAGMSMTQNCPVQVPGADVAVLDTDGGIALAITTPSGDVAELRRRVEAMTNMRGNDALHQDMMPFSVRYQDITNGARLVLQPKDPQNVGEFRTIVRRHAEQMKKTGCSAMPEMMDGTKTAEPAPKSETTPKSDESDHGAHHPGGTK